MVLAALLACQAVDAPLDSGHRPLVAPDEDTAATRPATSEATVADPDTTPASTLDTGPRGSGTASSTAETTETADTGHTDTSSTSPPGCTTGFAVGECPPDFALPDRNAEMVRLSDYPGMRVAVVGTAEW